MDSRLTWHVTANEVSPQPVWAEVRLPPGHPAQCARVWPRLAAGLLARGSLPFTAFPDTSAQWL